MDVQPTKKMTAHLLLCSIEDFIRDNRHSQDVGLRWLSQYLAELISPLLRQARSDAFEDATQKQINMFRLSEIEKSKSEKQREIEILEREAKSLSSVRET